MSDTPKIPRDTLTKSRSWSGVADAGRPIERVGAGVGDTPGVVGGLTEALV